MKSKMEAKYFLILFVAVILFVIYWRSTKKNDRVPETERAIGVIKMISETDSGYPWYQVEFEKDGMTYDAQSVYYWKVPKDLKIGDSLNIGYYFTKNGKARCVILEDGFTAVSDAPDRTPKFFLFFSILFLIVFLVCLAKSIL